VARKLAVRETRSYRATTMFVRFRETRNRLQVSLVEARRIDGKARHEHVAGLGSIEMPPSIADRIAFWNRLHQRLARTVMRTKPRVHRSHPDTAG
jgi:hypothetical protein